VVSASLTEDTSFRKLKSCLERNQSELPFRMYLISILLFPSRSSHPTTCSSYPILPHPFSSLLIPSYHIPFLHFSSHPTTSLFFSSHPILPHPFSSLLIPSYHIPFLLFSSIPSYPIPFLTHLIFPSFHLKGNLQEPSPVHQRNGKIPPL
jgi:hypothetical protein